MTDRKLTDPTLPTYPTLEDGDEVYGVRPSLGTSGSGKFTGNMLRGRIGPQGWDGEEGEPGPPIPGPQGPKGDKGDTGQQGIQGTPGPMGDTGEEGEPSYVPGPQGQKGDTGSTGAVGATGSPGPPGSDGEDGDGGGAGGPGLSWPTTNTAQTLQAYPYGSGFWSDVDGSSSVWRLTNRLFVGDAVYQDNTRVGAVTAPGWIANATVGANWAVRDSQLASMHQRGGLAVTGLSRSSDGDSTPSGPATIGVAGFTIGDTSGVRSCWAMYADVQFVTGTNAYGMELAIKNASATSGTPSASGTAGFEATPDFQTTGIVGLWMNTGDDSYGPAHTNPNNTAIQIGQGVNGNTWNRGLIVFGNALNRDTFGRGRAIGLGHLHHISWYDGSNHEAFYITSAVTSSGKGSSITANDFILQFFNQGGQQIADFVNANFSTANWLRFTNAVAATSPGISAQGTDANIDINLTPKGEGRARVLGDLYVEGTLTGGNLQTPAPGLDGDDAESFLLPGPQGIPGTAGTSGQQGPQGVQGIPGFTEEPDEAYTQPIPGAQGPAGPVGPAGNVTQIIVGLVDEPDEAISQPIPGTQGPAGPVGPAGNVTQIISGIIDEPDTESLTASGVSQTNYYGVQSTSILASGTVDWNSDTWLTRSAAATLQLGKADAAAPVAQTLRVQNVVAGTADTAGALFTIEGSAGTGAGVGGNILFQAADAGGSGSSQNTYSPVMLLAASNGRVLVGSTQTFRSVTNGGNTPKVQIQYSNTSSAAGAAVLSYQASDTLPATIYLGLSKSNTLGTQTTVVSGTQLGAITADGSDGTNFQDSGKILFACDGTVSSAIVPGRIQFFTATIAAGVITEAMRIDGNQAVIVAQGGYAGTNFSNNTVTPRFQVHRASSTSPGQNALSVSSWTSTTTSPATLFLSQSAGTTIGTQGAVASGTQLGAVTADGSDGSNLQDSSQILFACDGAVGAGHVPGRVVLSTATSAGTLTEAIRWDSSQNTQLPSASTLNWNADTFLSRNAAAALQLGQADAAAPVAQTLQAQSVVTGTSNTAGAALTINGSKGTGTGSGGAIIFQVAPGGGSGSSQNAYQVAIRIHGSGGQRLFGNVTGLANNVTNNSVTPQNQFIGISGESVAIYRYNASASAPARLFFAQSNNGTVNTQTAVASGNQLGQLIFDGSDGTNFQDSALITVTCDGTVSAGVVPGRITFSTTNGAGTMGEVVRIDRNGALMVSNFSTTARTFQNGAITPKLQVSWATTGSAQANSMSVASWNTSGASPATIFLGASNNASSGSFTAVTPGFQLGALNFEGTDGTNFQDSAQIMGECDFTVASGKVPGRLRFFTANATGQLCEAARWDHFQNTSLSGNLSLNGDVTANSGTAAAPSFNFSAHPTTGVYDATTYGTTNPSALPAFLMGDVPDDDEGIYYAPAGVISGYSYDQVNDPTNVQTENEDEEDWMNEPAFAPGTVGSYTSQTNTFSTLGFSVDGVVQATLTKGGVLNLTSTTVAAQITAAQAGAGALAIVNNADVVPAIGMPVTGGGTNKAIVQSDGTTWRGATSFQDFRNMCLNGSFDVWQRGAGDSSVINVGASTTAYTVDRWYLTTGANEACTVAAHTALTNKSRLACRVQRTNGQTGTTQLKFGYPFTTDEVNMMRGDSIALRIVLSTGANWSPTSGTLNVDVYFGTGTQGKRAGGFTNESHPLSLTVNLATSSGNVVLEGNSGTTTVATNATQGEIQLTWTPTGTAGVNDFVDLDDCQLEIGTVNTTFERLPFGTLLNEMRRHYIKTFRYSVAPAQATGDFAGSLGTNATYNVSTTGVGPWVQWSFPVEMIGNPVVTTYNPGASNANWRDQTGSADMTVSVDPAAAKSQHGVFISSAGGASNSASVGHTCHIHAQADAGL